MRITSTLRAGTLALALLATGTSLGTAFAADENLAARPQSSQSQTSNTGPYDGADFEAAKHAFN